MINELACHQEKFSGGVKAGSKAGSPKKRKTQGEWETPGQVLFYNKTKGLVIEQQGVEVKLWLEMEEDHKKPGI